MDNDKRRTVVALIVMVAVVTLAVMFMLNVKGCQAKVSAETTATTSTETSAEPTSTTTANPDDEKKAPTEADATSISVELLKKRFGEAPEFKSTSTLAEEGKRVEATKIYDAVTYKVVPPDNLEGIIKEILSNPIYLSGVDLALREVKLVGQSDWSNKFHQSFDPLTTGWWEKWVEKRSDGKGFARRDRSRYLPRDEASLRRCRRNQKIFGNIITGEKYKWKRYRVLRSTIFA